MTDLGDRRPFLVLGVGNELFTDEGVGVVAARRLAELAPGDVDVVDGSTLGIELAPTIADRPGLLVFDALAPTYGAPGTVVALRDGDIERHHRLVFSVHQLDLVDALAATELAGRAPLRFAAVAMVPASLETGYGLSPVAAAHVDEMVARAMEMLQSWGVRVAVHA